jgi:hypothetical protein
MAKSSVRGASTSAEVEVLGLTPHALWLLVRGRELGLDFTRFPWFARASLEQVCNVVLLHGQHLHWPSLDVDLHIDSVDYPERFPLVARTAVPRPADRPPRRLAVRRPSVAKGRSRR